MKDAMNGGIEMNRQPRITTRLIPLVLTFLLIASSTLPALAAPVEKDTAAGDEDSRMYGAGEDEIMMFADTATGDVNGDGLPDLVIGHDKGDDLYSGRVYVYYGRTGIPPEVDLGTAADVTISGWAVSFTGNSVACGDVDGDGIDDILAGSFMDSPAGAMGAGGVVVIFGGPSLPSAWDLNSTDPDLYFSSTAAAELCGISVAAGDIDGDGFDDILFGAPLANGGVNFFDGTGWAAQGRANQDSIYDVSTYSPSPGSYRGWAVGKYVSAYTTLYFFDGTEWSARTTGLANLARDFHGVSAFDTSHAWAVGSQGTIAFWNATAWATQASGVTTTLRDVWALDGSSVWAVGDGGVICKTSDGGANWSPQVSGTTAALRGVCAVDASNAWAVGDGGVIRKTSDGGANWSPQISGTTAALRGICAVDASNAWAVGDGGTVLYYNGSDWSAQTSNTTAALRGVCAVDASNAWAVGDGGTVLATSDGGANWARDNTVTFSQQLNAVDAFDATHAWTVGEAATGRAYLAWGHDRTYWDSLTWDHDNPIPPDLTFNGIDAFDYCGLPVSSGDLNGDSYDDIVVGAFEAAGPGNARAGCGEAYVVSGRPRASFPASVNLSGGASCTVYGGSAGDGFPTSIARPLRDLDGDGTSDLVFGSIFADGPGDARPGCGEVAVLYGGSLPPVMDLASRAPDVMLYGPSPGAGAGRDVTVLDFDADGIMDLAAGAPNTGMGAERPNCGVAWLARGSDPWPAQVDLAVAASMVFYGAETNDAFGFCLAAADLDGDPEGFDDLVISAANGAGPSNARPYCGEHYIFLGYDYVPPTCAITNVTEGAVLAGTVGVNVNASDAHGIERVEFRVDGGLEYVDTAAPWRWDWDTRDRPDGGPYTLEVRAYDKQGNSAADSRRVSLNNTVPPLSDLWYLAEGTTAWGFETYVLVQNPNPSPTDVTFTFMKPGGAVQSETFPLAGNSRFTVLVNSFVDSSDVSTRVEGGLPIICERAMYYTPPGGAQRTLGHDSTGVAEPSPTWYLAEGTTAWGFETYVLVQNPEPDEVEVAMTFMKPGGEVQVHEFTVAGQARYTVNVGQEVAESDVSTRVEASGPVICERAMYRGGKALGHGSIGTPSTSHEWYLAEGTTAWGYDTYVLVQNPGPQPAAVGVRFMLPDGNVVPYGILVPAQSRYTIHVDEVPGCESTDLSTYITSTRPVICERAMYWQGASSPGGHDTIGTPLPSRRWYLAEGTTAWGFEEYVLVQNPNPQAAVVSFTFMRPDGTTEFVSYPVAGSSRFSLRVNDVVTDSDVSTSVLSDLPVICERAMYAQQRDIGHVTIGVRGD